MHVLILPSWYFPADSLDISGRMFHHLASALRKDDVDARILYAELKPVRSFSKKLEMKVEDGVPTWRARQFFPPKMNSLFIRKWINKYVGILSEYISSEGSPDLLHAQSYLTAMVCAELKRTQNIPFIYTERLSAFISGNIPDRYVPFIKEASSEASVITTVSPGLASYLKKYTSKEIEVVPNFYDPEVFFFDPSVPKNNAFTFVSVGEPSHTKGLDILIGAMGLVKENFPDEMMQLILVDKISEKEKLISLSEKHGISDRIFWTGLLTQMEIGSLLRKCHALVSASRMETFGKAIVEAQACGLPVIATKTDGAKFILQGNEQGILVETESVNELAEAMMEMKKDHHRYESAKIVSTVSSRFSQRVVVDQWKTIYARIAR